MDSITESQEMYQTTIQSDIGSWILTASTKGLTSLTIQKKELAPNCKSNDILIEAVAQLNAYLKGQLQNFDLPIDFADHSLHRIKVWKLLMGIPYGKSISYQELSLRYGDIKSIRAVANANGRNPLPIIIPCHRVIGKDGSLTGFSLGLPIKEWLLRLENHPRYHNSQTSLNFD